MFDTILEKLGLKTSKPQVAQSPAAKSAPLKVESASLTRHAAPAPAEPVRSTTAPITVVDVTSKLEELAAANSQKLNWKTSIVDLLKLLGIDSSLAARKELATELGCPAERMGDSASMNQWLQKTVLRKLAENGGKVPAELL